MARPTSTYVELPGQKMKSGIQVDIYPSTVRGLLVEIQISTASSAASSNWASYLVGPSSAMRLRHTFEMPDSTRTYFLRGRHPTQAGYVQGAFTPTLSAKPQRLSPQVATFVGDDRFSSHINAQGSVLPVPFGASLFTGSWGGIGAGQMFVAFSWAAQTLRLADGSTISMPVPPAPTTMTALSQSAGGVRGALTLFARIGLVKDGHLYAVSNESSLAVSANNLLTIASPASVAGYDGWAPLIGSVTNQEYVQESDATPYPIPFGTNYNEPTAHFKTLDSQYAAAWQNAVVYVDMNPTTTYYFYPFWDIANAMVRFAPSGGTLGDTAPSMADANKAWSDGRIALSGANMQVAIGAGGGSGSPATGGSRLT